MRHRNRRGLSATVERRMKDQGGGETLGERVNEDRGRCWESALVFKGRVCRADSYVQLTDSDRSTMSKERM